MKKFILLAFMATVGLTSCNVTRASIRQPRSGSTTSITITTNNPSTVEVSPDVDVLSKP